MKNLVFVGILLILNQIIFAQTKGNYKIPPTEIIDLLEAKGTPDVLVDPTGEWLMQISSHGFPSIAELTKPELRIAGVRIDTVTHYRSRTAFINSVMLTNLKTGKDFEVSGLPENPKLGNFEWSPSGEYVAFTHNSAHGVDLWVLDVDNKTAKILIESVVNAVIPIKPVIWMDAGKWLIFTSVVQNRGQKPEKPSVPYQPNTRESQSSESAAQYYQDLLLNESDEDIFEYYATSQLMKINLNKDVYPIGIPAIFKEFLVSPDFRFLLVKMIHKPFSYLVPYNFFPYKVEIWDNDGNLFREIFEIPLAESIPKGFGAVQKSPRDISWRGDKPATLFWVKALDGGDPKRDMVICDRLFMFDFPFDGDGYTSVGFKNRFRTIQWGNSNVAICTERSWKTGTETVSSFSPDEPDGGVKIMLFEYNWLDDYSHPGIFITKKNESGYDVLNFSERESNLYLKGEQASPEGSKPFLDSYNLKTAEQQRLWQSTNPYYEVPLVFIDAGKEIILTRSESRIDPPNYFSRNLKNGVVSQITNYQNPYPQLDKMHKEMLKYSRNDSVQLTGTLYTPPGFSVGDGMLPVLMWVYSNTSENKTYASQVKKSPNKFIAMSWDSPIFWVMRGYAVFDNPSMPIIVEDDSDPSIAFNKQLAANASAALHCLDSLGIADLKKVAIGGHGFGAFLAVNLLTHTNLFVAGIARSGVYNLTLTPFGFDSEQRTFWEARDEYMQISPFLYANKIKAPLLLMHGDANDNENTNPMQSEQMFTALKANGGKVRLVTLPNESFEYKAKENIYHMLWEMDTWLEKYLKQK